MSFLGRGHSGSDVAVLIPEEKILLMGCFFLERGPLPYFGAQPVLDPDRWLAVLDGLLEDETAVTRVVLGQHTVWPRQRLVAVRDYIARLWSDVQRLDAEGVDFDTALDRLPPPTELDFLRSSGATDEQLARFHRFEATALWRQVKDSAAAAVEQAINEGGAAAGVARYQELASREAGDVYFDEADFNLLGYRLLGEGRIDEAIAVFQLNVDRYPESWNVYDSLGEAWAAKGDTGKAIELYNRSLELNPANTNAVQAIGRLRAEATAAPAEG
jgi:tetratricopeptide (TPR) repeat protein